MDGLALIGLLALVVGVVGIVVLNMGRKKK